MHRYLLIALCLAAAGCDKRDIPVATEGGKPGFIVNGSLYGFHPTVDDAKADAVTRVHGQCPNGAEAISATLTSQMTTGYLTNTYQATVVCK
jgi:hypothetical protein